MVFLVDGVEREFIPIKQFREEQSLPESFSIRFFMPKDFSALGSIDKAGSEMNDVRKGVLAFVPEKLSKMDLLPLADSLQAVFRAALYAINDKIGLKVEEAEFAVAGFGDVLRYWVYALIREDANFHAVYAHWLNESIRVSHIAYPYEHQGETWQVYVINHAYGRFGLRVETALHTLYLVDMAYTCPAEGYMQSLLSEICAAMQSAL